MAEWWWKADYIETCNCAYGCHCNLTMIPNSDDGSCQAINAWRIGEGAAGDVRLDGLGVALLSRWPGPIHHGNGQGFVYVDERADDAQREALARIGRGEAGAGGPFEIFNSMYNEPAKPIFGPFEFEFGEKQASVRLGDAGRAEVEPIRADMDQSEADVHLVIPGGFIFADGQMVSTKECVVSADGLDFRHERTSAFLARVEYNV